MASSVKILSVIGTRPELIKMAPVLTALARDGRAESRVCLTGQHRSMLDDLLPLFGVRPDINLDVMRPGQTPNDVLAAALTGLQPLLAAERPDWVVAQGDTTTVLAASISAFHARIPFAHVEAGLRSGDFGHPFPEEFNRRVADLTAGLCFAPTGASRDHLLAEGVDPEKILITGNTGIDALVSVTAMAIDLPEPLRQIVASRDRVVVVTAHRRENFGARFEAICEAVRELARHGDDVRIVWPVHLNPNVREPVFRILGGLDNVTLTEPLGYAVFAHLMKRATVILSDSGGVQEEAPSLGVPVLVLRDVTERPEGVAAGCARLVGTDRRTIVDTARHVLDHPDARARMTAVENPYGDGRASQRIVAALVGDAVEAFRAGTGPDDGAPATAASR